MPKRELKRGDTITVRVTNTGRSRGFACVIKRNPGDAIVSGAEWRSYTPADEANWSDPKSIRGKRRVFDGTNRIWKNKLITATDVACESIWPEERSDTGYLIFEVE